MPACNCQGSTCSCLIIGVANTTVTGTGTKADPYTIEFDLQGFSIAENIQFVDTDSIAFTTLGTGTGTDPEAVRATVVLVSPNGTKYGPSVTDGGVVSWAVL